MAGGNGIFGQWQPRYAEAGLAAFPVEGKKPMVSHYLRAGLRASHRYADRFADAPALGVACARAKLTVIDVDTTDERVLADALGEYGPTPVIVRSGSGHFQAWYRNSGEPRKIRPDARPIDILGGGFVVVPPSRGAKGVYEFLQGSLADVGNLPRLGKLIATAANDAAAANPAESPAVGKRNATLFAEAMKLARKSESLEALMAHVGALNAGYADPLPQSEAVRVAQNAWGYESRGENRFGKEQAVEISRADVFTLAAKPDAFVLLSLLRLHNWDRSTFLVANEMAHTMPPAGWARKRFAAARADLIDLGYLIQTRRPSQAKGAALYRFR